MNEERRRVLEMVAAGTITPEQGDELLDALSTETVRKSEPAAESRVGRRLKSPKFTTEELIQLGNHGVDATYMRGLRDAGLLHLSVDEIIGLYNHGVQPEFIREMQVMGFIDLTSNKLIELANHGVDEVYVREMVREEEEEARR